MKDRETRIADLVLRGAAEREMLALEVEQISHEVARRRMQWKITGALAGGLAAAGTVAWKLLGRSSPAARIGRATSAVSLALGLGRALLRLRRFL